MKKDLIQWAAAPASWITSPGESLGGTILSSRVRLARNIRSHSFPHHSTMTEQKQTLKETLTALKKVSHLRTSISFELKSLEKFEKRFLMERQLISHDQAFNAGERGLVVSSGEALSIMLNEEDHIRAASFKPGLELKEAWSTLSQLDDELDKNLDIAFDKDFGYLTAWPTNTGTGMRASCLLHLPVLTLTGGIKRILNQLQQSGFAVRGFYGEGTDALGDLFQVSNSQSLGITEKEILTVVERVVQDIATEEKKAEDRVMKSGKRGLLEDHVYRSWGTLHSARLLNFEEAMRYVSLVRLGKRLNFDIGAPIQELTNLFFLIQPAHIAIRKEGKQGVPVDEGSARSMFLRQKLSSYR